MPVLVKLPPLGGFGQDEVSRLPTSKADRHHSAVTSRLKGPERELCEEDCREERTGGAELWDAGTNTTCLA